MQSLLKVCTKQMTGRQLINQSLLNNISVKIKIFCEGFVVSVTKDSGTLGVFKSDQIESDAH